MNMLGLAILSSLLAFERRQASEASAPQPTPVETLQAEAERVLALVECKGTKAFLEATRALPEALAAEEQARLSLANFVLAAPSWLALDEPTNYLDLPGRTALEEMLGEFTGALVFVSHDREFIDGLATRILEVADGVVRSFPGNYSDYRKTVLAEGVAAREQQAVEKERKATAAKARAVKSAPARKEKAKNPWLLRQVEDTIMALEAEQTQLLAALGEERVYKDATLAKETQQRLAEIERELEEKNAEWEAMI